MMKSGLPWLSFPQAKQKLTLKVIPSSSRRDWKHAEKSSHPEGAMWDRFSVIPGETRFFNFKTLMATSLKLASSPE
jgi:hypothetical protein